MNEQATPSLSENVKDPSRPLFLFMEPFGSQRISCAISDLVSEASVMCPCSVDDGSWDLSSVHGIEEALLWKRQADWLHLAPPLNSSLWAKEMLMYYPPKL